MHLLDPRAKVKTEQNSIPSEWKILLVTPMSNPETPNFISKVDTHGKYKWLDAETPAMGIRFIAENYKGIEVLECPTIREYEEQLSKGFDIVGISFLTFQMENAKQMVDLARKYGVKEVWGGGWGIDTPGARAFFDRSFAGHGEQLLYPILANRWKDYFRHPILIGPTKF